MTKRLSKLTDNSNSVCLGKATIALLAIAIVFSTSSGRAQQVSSQCSGPEKAAEVAGVKFMVPQCFKLERTADDRVAFMRHQTDQLALFVVVTDRQADNSYLTNISNNLVSRLLPQQRSFSWKVLRQTSGRKISGYETSRGVAKGFNEKIFVQTDYVALKAQGHDVIIGSVAKFGTRAAAKYLYEAERSEYSFPGWQGLFHLIASVTGERHIDDPQ
jgi:hypothetical protein